MLLTRLVDASNEVAGLRGRKAKVAVLAKVLTQAEGQIGLAAVLLAGELPDGRIGVGPSQLVAVGGTEPADEPSLTLTRLRQDLSEIASIRGKGSKARRQAALTAMWSASTPSEQDFLGRLLFGELRQGAQASLVTDAVAEATQEVLL